MGSHGSFELAIKVFSYLKGKVFFFSCFNIKAKVILLNKEEEQAAME